MGAKTGAQPLQQVGAFPRRLGDEIVLLDELDRPQCDSASDRVSAVCVGVHPGAV